MNYDISCKVQIAKYGRVIFSQEAEMGYLKILLSKWHKACQAADIEEFHFNINKIYMKQIKPVLYVSAEHAGLEQFIQEIIFSAFQHISENELKTLNDFAEKIGEFPLTHEEHSLLIELFQLRSNDFSSINLDLHLLGK